MALVSKKRTNYKKASVRIYHGYGHSHDLLVYGHAFKKKPFTAGKIRNNIFFNIIRLFRLFFVQPLPGALLRLKWKGEIYHTKSEYDGFFKFEWSSATEMTAGTHPVTIELLDEEENPVTTGEDILFIPHSTQFAFISDIDDTILISHSATILKRLRELFTRNAHSRQTFPAVAEHYNLLTTAHTTTDVPNPFFYVSSSEWNLYDYLRNFFHYNQLPGGAFLLSQIKKWFELLKTGKTNHQGKLLKIVRIMEVFPIQKFILLGDNSQSDPAIYATIATKMKGRIFAVYIRNVHSKNETTTIDFLKQISEAGVHTCFFTHSKDAIEHSKQIGLID